MNSKYPKLTRDEVRVKKIEKTTNVEHFEKNSLGPSVLSLGPPSRNDQRVPEIDGELVEIFIDLL